MSSKKVSESSLDNATVEEAGIIITGVSYVGAPWAAGDEMHVKAFTMEMV